jgi:hypothetical protein
MIHYDCLECRGEGVLFDRMLQRDVSCECTDDLGDMAFERDTER